MLYPIILIIIIIIIDANVHNFIISTFAEANKTSVAEQKSLRARLTILASLDEENFRLSRQTWTILFVEEFSNCVDGNQLRVTRVQFSQISMRHKDTSECIVASVINFQRDMEQCFLQFVEVIVFILFHNEMKA